MVIGEKLRELRKAKNLSQGDLEKRTGLLRCYSSRVENGHTVPSIETLAKYARALEVPLYRFFCDGDEPPKVPELPRRSPEWGATGKQSAELRRFTKLLARMEDRDRALLLAMAQAMVPRRRKG